MMLCGTGTKVMLSSQEQAYIARCARKHAVRQVLLFGSSLDRDDARDIDLGVEGVVPGTFFKLYADLLRGLPKPVDLVDLSDGTLFCRLVREEGRVIYG